jgi:lysophospholipase L1-like esterase
VLLTLALLGGCSSDGRRQALAAADERAGKPLDIDRYVAMGDSFTAAPFVPETELALGCFRSSGNYPALVATALGAELVDVSCSAATSRDITGEQAVAGGRGSVAPQLAAVRPDTELVTLSIGGNDGNLFGTLVTRCTGLARQHGSPCEEQLADRYGDRLMDEIRRRVADLVGLVRDAAPEARVVVVGYPRLVAADRGCAQLPLAAGDRRWMAGVEQRLGRALAVAARSGGADYLDMYAASAGHEVCSDDPWVNGRRTDQRRALAFHPFVEGQQAVADALLDLLRG